MYAPTCYGSCSHTSAPSNAQEQEQEQEIEIEKFVDLAYSRENESPTPWPLETLSQVPGALPPQFYPSSGFRLYRRRPLALPSDVLISSNYFNRKWSGCRRLKNIAVVLEWVPASLSALEHGRAAVPADAEDEAERAMHKVP